MLHVWEAVSVLWGEGEGGGEGEGDSGGIASVLCLEREGEGEGERVCVVSVLCLRECLECLVSVLSHSDSSRMSWRSCGR